MHAKNQKRPDDTDLEAAGHEPTGAAGQDGAADESIADILRQRDDLDEKYKRSLADFRNYQQRALANEREARRQGAADVLQSVIRILDHFDLALSQDPATATSEQILHGVKLIREELMRAVGSQGVTTIEPAPNDDFDPHLHQAVQHFDAPGVAPGHVSVLLQPGYALGDRVLRPAKVAVAPGASASEMEDEGAGAADR